MRQHERNAFDPRDVERAKSDLGYLQRFCADRETKEKALDMLIRCLKWRKEFGVYDITAESLSEEALALCGLYFHGTDKVNGGYTYSPLSVADGASSPHDNACPLRSLASQSSSITWPSIIKKQAARPKARWLSDACLSTFSSNNS